VLYHIWRLSLFWYVFVIYDLNHTQIIVIILYKFIM